MSKKAPSKLRKRKKFHELSFKISAVKKEQLDILCIETETTVNKILRNSIYQFIEDNKELLEAPKKFTAKNQLKLFNVEEYDKGGFQLEIEV